MTRIRVRRLSALAGLDEGEIAAGYMAGTRGAPEPGGDASYAFWHGWCSAAIDRGDRRWDEAQAELVDDLRRSRR